MTAVSIRLPDDLLKEADKLARELHIPRHEYIRRAIEALNTVHPRVCGERIPGLDER
jgi:predicted transcriptional regulator